MGLQRAGSNAPLPPPPPLLTCRCTSAPATQAFVAAAGSADKTLHLVPGGFHEVLMSPGVGEGLAGGMVAWIKQHSGAGGGSAGGGGAGGGSAKM